MPPSPVDGLGPPVSVELSRQAARIAPIDGRMMPAAAALLRNSRRLWVGGSFGCVMQEPPSRLVDGTPAVYRRTCAVSRQKGSPRVTLVHPDDGRTTAHARGRKC